MQEELYPLQFKSSLHYRIWGGNVLRDVFKKQTHEENMGESWEISTVPGYISKVENGSLVSNDFQSLINIYKDKLVGKKVFNKYENNFPLLIKFISANAPLSVQVHPDDAYASKHHNSYGKTEMWYIMDVTEDAEMIIGFKKGVTKEIYLEKLSQGRLEEILNKVKPKVGEVYFLPAGRVHAIGKGITLAEIQQNSDITYRIYDYNRIDKDGKYRELHTENALDVMDFSFIKKPHIEYSGEINETINIVNSDFFNTSIIKFSTPQLSQNSTDSFTIYMCIEGSFHFLYKNKNYLVNKGETIFIPAIIQKHEIKPIEYSEILKIKV